MTDLQQAAQKALEALETLSKLGNGNSDGNSIGNTIAQDARTALSEALAQPEQEPTCPKCKAVVLYECVACSNNNYPPRPEQEPCIGKDPRCPCQDGDACHYKDCGDTKALPVPVAQPEPTPRRDMVVVSLVREGIDKHRARELADHFAAQRPWQGLTQEEIWKGLTDADWSNIMDRRDTSLDTFQQGVVWAQARLKERNHG